MTTARGAQSLLSSPRYHQTPGGLFPQHEVLVK